MTQDKRTDEEYENQRNKDYYRDRSPPTDKYFQGNDQPNNYGYKDQQPNYISRDYNKNYSRENQAAYPERYGKVPDRFLRPDYSRKDVIETTRTPSIHMQSIDEPQKEIRPRYIHSNPGSVLRVGGLCTLVLESDLNAFFKQILFGISSFNLKMILDDTTGKCRGLCYITFNCINDAIEAKFRLKDKSFRGQELRCDYRSS